MQFGREKAEMQGGLICNSWFGLWFSINYISFRDWGLHSSKGVMQSLFSLGLLQPSQCFHIPPLAEATAV